MDERTLRIHEAADSVRARLGGRKPLVGIVLGSGLGKLAEQISDRITIPYSEIPGFPSQTVVGHAGNLICGYLGGKCVLALQGRFHYYQGYPMELVTLPIRTLKLLGISYLFVSNAAGGVSFELKVGDIMVIRDHINLLPNPLIGRNMDEFGPRFPDMTRPYDPSLIALAEKISEGLGFSVRKGVYLGDTGPSYETPAEYKFYRSIGADAVGMSTVPEVIVARHSSIPVFGVSVITNEAHDDYAEDYKNDGDDVVQAANAAADKMTALFTAMIESL